MEDYLQKIQKQIDDLIEKANGGDVTLSPEVLDLLDEIVNYTTLVKAKDKTKPIEDLILKLEGLVQTLSDNQNVSKESHDALLNAIKEIKIDVASPEVHIQAPEVNVPPVKMPQVIVPKIELPEINIPQAKVDTKSLEKIFKDFLSTFKQVEFPKSAKEAVAVRLSDGEKFYRAIGGLASAIGGAILPFRDSTATPQAALVDSDYHLQVDDLSGTTRVGSVLHRSNLIATDKLATPATPVLQGVTVSGGTLTSGTTYNVAVSAVTLQPGSGTIIGHTPASSIASLAPGGTNNALRITMGKVTNADGYWIFLSTDAAPRLTVFITEAQRAAGGVITAVMGTVSAGTAGVIDLGATSTTGLQTTNTTITNFNTAHVLNGITSISCTGYKKALIHARWKYNMPGDTAITTIASIVLLPWLKSKETLADWFYTSPLTMGSGQSAAEGYQQVAELDVSGATSMIITCATFAGSGSVDVWVEFV